MALAGFCEFDRLANVETNFDKSFFFANPVQLQEQISLLQPQGLPLSFVNSFKLTGSVVTVRGSPGLSSRDSRVDAAVAKLHKVEHAPLRFDSRARRATTAAVPTAALSIALSCLSWALPSTHACNLLQPKDKTWEQVRFLGACLRTGGLQADTKARLFNAMLLWRQVYVLPAPQAQYFSGSADQAGQGNGFCRPDLRL